MFNDIAIFALIFAASAISPGPDTMTIFSRGLSAGYRAAFPFTIGVILAKLSLLTLVIVGLAAALLPAVLDVQKIDISTYLALCLTLTVIMVAVAAIYAVLAGRLRNLFSSAKARKTTNRVAGSVMIGSSFWVASR